MHVFVFAVIVGVSIDYLIYLAFAYNNSILADRYYKSRAAFLARLGGIGTDPVERPASPKAPAARREGGVTS